MESMTDKVIEEKVLKLLPLGAQLKVMQVIDKTRNICMMDDERGTGAV